jgi:putative intracellular protease/amidase
MDGPLEPDRFGRMMFRLPWFENGDRLDVAIAANAAARAGLDVHRALEDGPGVEKGDYLIEADAPGSIPGHGLAVESFGLPAGPRLGRIHAPRIALLAGSCSSYPYYGYYALALMRLGYVFTVVDGADIAGGVLDRHDLLVLPGGFSNWTLDFKENTSGADDALRAFLKRGGTVVASCGGAFYLSRGRQGWLGVADARPFNTQEYLRTGVAVLTCTIDDERLGIGLPPTLEIPYFHGPVWDDVGEGTEPLLSFRDYYGHGRLFIDNPLSRDVFERDMQGRVAALRTSGRRGRSVLFSPHPEMGDLLRKYMALETYIPRYQPVRGDLVMRETLATYRPRESRSFLLILNAIEDLTREASAFPRPDETSAGPPALGELETRWRRRAEALVPSAGGVGMLESEVLASLRLRFDQARPLADDCWASARPDLRALATRLVRDITASLEQGPGKRPAEILLELELACLLIESWCAVAAFDGHS